MYVYAAIVDNETGTPDFTSETKTISDIEKYPRQHMYFTNKDSGKTIRVTLDFTDKEKIT